MNRLILALFVFLLICDANAQDYPYTVTRVNGIVQKNVSLLIVSEDTVKVEGADTSFILPVEDILKINYYVEGGGFWGLKKGFLFGAAIGALGGGLVGSLAKLRIDSQDPAWAERTYTVLGYALAGALEVGVLGGLFGIPYGIGRAADETHDFSGMTGAIKKQAVFNVINRIK